MINNRLTDEQVHEMIAALSIVPTSKVNGDIVAALTELQERRKAGEVHDLFLRAKALMYQSGGSPIENSLNPIDAWLHDAEHAASHPAQVVVAECEICGKSCANPNHPMKAVAVEPPISAEFKAARNTLKFLNYTWTGGEHWRPPLGLPPESVTGIDYKKLVEEISCIVFGNLDHVEHLPIVIRATFGRFHSWS